MTRRQDGAGFSIGDLSRQSGVPVVTIRAWERRYNLLSPDRSPGGHRRFDDEDLRRLSAVCRLVSEGVSVAAAARRVTGHEVGGSLLPAGSPERPAVPAPMPLPTAGLDPQALEAAYRATRSLLHVRSPEDAAGVLVDLVADLGGAVVPARQAGPDALPLDLSLGVSEPLLPVAEPFSIARLQLERVLPTVLEDARRAAAIARLLARGEGKRPRG